MTHTHRENSLDATEKSRISFPAGGMTLLLVFLFISFAIYVFWQKKTVSNQVSVLEERIAAKEAAIDEYTKGKSIEDHMSAIDMIEIVLEEQFDWSDANREIELTGKALQGSALFESYTSSSDGTFTLSGVSPSLEGVAKTIDKFASNSSFSEPFVSNISEQSNSNTRFSGRIPSNIYPFSLSFVYIPQE